MRHPLADTLASLLGQDAGVGHARINVPGGLYPEELSAVDKAVTKRQAEFGAGRRAARRALTALGHPAVAIPAGEHRAPVWPKGIVGAITHDRGHALAAVLPADRAAGLGIDLTEAAALPGETRRAILPLETEQGLDALEARAGFSAKETLFKALFPSIRDHFGFDAASVAPDLDRGAFSISLARDLGGFPEGTSWQGRLCVSDGLLLTVLRLPHR